MFPITFGVSTRRILCDSTSICELRISTRSSPRLTRSSIPTRPSDKTSAKYFAPRQPARLGLADAAFIAFSFGALDLPALVHEASHAQRKHGHAPAIDGRPRPSARPPRRLLAECDAHIGHQPVLIRLVCRRHPRGPRR